MNVSKTNEWLSLLANVGVVAGIVFLAVEVQQNNRLLAAQDSYNRLEVATRSTWTTVNNPQLNAIGMKMANGQELDNEEENIASQAMDGIFKGWEWTFYEIPEDSIPKRRWQ